MDIIQGSEWSLCPDTSYATGIAYIYAPLTETSSERIIPQIPLVHQIPGEVFGQKDSNDHHIRTDCWKMPIGRPDLDESDPVVTCTREVLQETGMSVGEFLDMNHALIWSKRSQRLGSEYHDDIFFHVITSLFQELNDPASVDAEDVDYAKWWPLDKLPLTGDEDGAQGVVFTPGHRKKLAEILSRVPDMEWYGRRVSETMIEEVIANLLNIPPKQY